ncbi:hypothetical protein L1987_05691 [Smallanthus sonchifolius]|uniref:Uncharacterized protein n=1 Tax=Smallanthus sonchifolius TaxID=185202 RepID=A0ACB9JW35_9ASTR|nr:hypothetical protein L1987_05691 [Smallanthus sonchifolius]
MNGFARDDSHNEVWWVVWACAERMKEVGDLIENVCVALWGKKCILKWLLYRALLSAVAKCIRGFIKLRIALGTLHGALPDATSEEIETYDDECAICREPMAKAKKLSCNQLFHLSCLRSWWHLDARLDQGLSDNYSCPTCLKPLFVGAPEGNSVPHSGDVSSDEQLARQLCSTLELQNDPTGVIPL